MARLLTCGFEAGAISQETAEMGGLYLDAGMAYSSAVVRSGAKSLLVSGGSPGFDSWLGCNTNPAYNSTSTIYQRCAVYGTTWATSSDAIIQAWQNGSTGLQLILGAGGQLLLADWSSNAIVATGPTLSTGQWYVIETSYVPSTGAAVLRVNGQQVAAGTLETVTTSAGPQFCGAPSSSCTIYFDDLAVNDSTGAAQNTWCGPGQVYFLKGTADAVRVGFTTGAGLPAVNGSAFTAPGSATTSATFTVPSGLTTGELLVATVQVFNPADAAVLTPASGWSLVTNSSYHQNSTQTTSDHWQVATFIKTYAGETGTETVCTSATAGGITVVMASVTGAGPVDITAVAHTTYSGSLPAAGFADAGVTTTQAGDLVLAACFNDQGFSYSTPSGWTSLGTGVDYGLFSKSQAAAGAIGSTTFTANAAADQTVTEIAITPAPLYLATNQTPSTAVAQGSATATSQIEDATSNTTDYYQAYVESTSTLGSIVKGSVPVLAQGWCSHGNSSATSRTNGLSVPSGAPVIGETTGSTPAVAAGAWPTGWAPLQTAYSYWPAINANNGCTLKFRKGTASTDYAMCAAMALMVEYAAPTPQTPRRSNQAMIRAMSR
jgi:hypothetical protein